MSTETTLGNATSDNSDTQTTAKLPWMQWQVGQRVVVRYRLADGRHDALGHLLEVEPDYVVVNTRRGVVKVLAETMVTGKLVPESPFPLHYPGTPAQ
ncbi:hypothetical protein HMPREF0044_0640 [Gleimia coleocanis DSM 15436]|uniref:Histone acetyltransferase Rv0428c-like SH3 domain-containing protein n=1 Tax=Gleimia coleocanis DSM 15436 TaxID=525245 RepID=C0W0P7_9ACTO|nr:hypothetical protein [Gleimia coleocanis]EEH63621.1 hypothetical protein HMPREF0044_0640 [Gleimia coleocanis DSM 15436]